MSIDRGQWKPLSTAMRQAIANYDSWSRNHLEAGDLNNKITAPLYHYTDANGLKSIVEGETIYFTSYGHLNDPGEITFGIGVTTALLEEIGQQNDKRIKLFCDMLIDLFTHDNMRTAFGFFIASFSRDGDDLGQWRAYGDNGRGFALGIAPEVFQAKAGRQADPTNNYVVLPVVYGVDEGRALLLPGIAKVVEQVAEILTSEADAMQDPNVGMPFFDEMAKALIASELVLYSMTIKHEAYRHEREVRLALVGQTNHLASKVLTCTRRSEIVPYIAVKMPLAAPDSIAEVVVGPAASPNSEDSVKSLLPHLRSVSVRRSSIPYRAS